MSANVAASPSPSSSLTAPSTRRALWALYAVVVLAAGLLQGVAELQHYLANGGRHVWEPLLWELSSHVCTGALGVAVYRWHAAGLKLHSRWRQTARHLLGAPVYMLSHVGGMFAIRYAVYALAGMHYEPGNAGQILAYEAGKDLASYGLMLALCQGLWLYFEAQRRQQELARLRGELAEARLSRLAEQIQPHFLFSVRSRLRIEIV